MRVVDCTDIKEETVGHRNGRRRRRGLVLVVVPWLLAVAATGCGGGSEDAGGEGAAGTVTPTGAAGAAAEPTARPTVDRTVERVITADGALQYPDDPHTLAFGVAGTLAELGAAENEDVAQGQVLARLDTLALDLALAEARAGVATAQARVRQLESGSALAQARIEVERAKNTLWGNQAQRDAACGRADNGNLPGSVRDEARTSCDGAQASVQASEQGVALAELNVRQAEATAGDDLAAAEAQLASARLSLRQAETNLGRATLTAPFTGTVTAIQPLVGDTVSPGAPVLTLTRTRPLRFVTTNLGERFVGDIQVGDAAGVTLTAYPDHVITGKVARIDDLGKLDETGAVVFAVHVDVDETDGVALRAGMTGRVEITVGGEGSDAAAK